MTGASLTTDKARTLVQAHKEDVARFVSALEAPEDEDQEEWLRAEIPNSYRKMATFAAYAGDDEEATRDFQKATKWSIEYVDAVRESPDRSLRGKEGALALVNLVEVAVLSGDEQARTEASEHCLEATVEDAGEYEGHVALAKALAALLLDDDVEERLDAVPTDGDVPDLVLAAAAGVRGVHEGRADAAVSAIEGVLEAHAAAADEQPSDDVCLDALALYVLAYERSLVAYDDVSTHREFLPEYRPERH